MLLTVFRFIALALVSLVTLTATSTISSYAAVWETQNRWSEQWEQNYSEWVQQNWDKDFFARPGTPWKGLILDCADTVYSMRIVYSYLHALPFVMKDSTGGKVLVSNEMSRWDDKPDQAQRVRQFLRFVYAIGGTSSLPNDTFPVALNREWIKSGALILTDRANHHSWTIKSVSEFGVPFLLYSSRPAKNILLTRNELPTTGFIFAGKLRPERHAGFRYFRQPEYINKPVWEVPGYSLDQYQVPLARWRAEVQGSLALVNETHEGRIQRLLENVCQSSQERIQVVQDGVSYSSRKSGCLNPAEYDDYSTPNRDARLKGNFEDLDEAYALAVSAKANLSVELKLRLRSVIPQEQGAIPPGKEYCRVHYTEDKVMTLGEVRRRSTGDMLSNNPHDPMEYRWGDVVGNSPRARRCPKY
jgi:hypothetical protein